MDLSLKRLVVLGEKLLKKGIEYLLFFFMVIFVLLVVVEKVVFVEDMIVMRFYLNFVKMVFKRFFKLVNVLVVCIK